MKPQSPGAALKALHKPHTAICSVCGKEFQAVGNAATCSTACRSKKYRMNKKIDTQSKA